MTIMALLYCSQKQ